MRRKHRSKHHAKPIAPVALTNGMEVRISARATVHANKVGIIFGVEETAHGPSIVRVAFKKGHQFVVVRYTRDEICDLKIAWEGNALLKEQQLRTEERLRQCARAGDLSTLVDI